MNHATPELTVHSHAATALSTEVDSGNPDVLESGIAESCYVVIAQKKIRVYIQSVLRCVKLEFIRVSIRSGRYWS